MASPTTRTRHLANETGVGFDVAEIIVCVAYNPPAQCAVRIKNRGARASFELVVFCFDETEVLLDQPAQRVTHENVRLLDSSGRLAGDDDSDVAHRLQLAAGAS